MDPFVYIDSQTTPDDRASLLAIQEAARALGPYAYLEIGSHLGGTIQPHIVDPLCRRIYSIDKRPTEQPDERGRSYSYGPANTTQRMLNHLAAIPGADLAKLQTFDSDAGDLSPLLIADTPTYCFVDAEHTDRAIQSDFAFCERVSHGQLVFACHDAYVVYRGLKTIIDCLTKRYVLCRVLFLPSHLFLIDTVGRISNHPAVISRALESWRGYLEGLLINDWYKQEFLKLCPDRNIIAI